MKVSNVKYAVTVDKNGEVSTSEQTNRSNVANLVRTTLEGVEPGMKVTFTLVAAPADPRPEKVKVAPAAETAS